MRQALLALAVLLPALPADARLLAWPDLTSRAKPRADATVSYGPAAEQKVDVWLPSATPTGNPHPVVLMVHGGCWQTSIADRSLMNWIADDLRRAGVAVWNIDYRGVDRRGGAAQGSSDAQRRWKGGGGGGYPGTFRDVATAADALGIHARRYNLDPTRVVAVGHSAGGHLALWLAARPRLPRHSPLRTGHPLPIARVISLGGLPDLEAVARSPDNGCGTEVAAKLTSGHWADTSVPRLLPLRVPQDLVNGREDRIIPFRLATDYVEQARKAGDAVTLHTVANTGHVELIAPESAAWGETRRLILTALGEEARR